jgi:hypothetical protein
MLMTRILEIILIVLILRALFPLMKQLLRGGSPAGREPVKRYEEDRSDFDKKKMDIVDGEFKELK